jgi:siroheme synthase (precorrin-2 oxidase/ferrochelatase)
MPARDEGGEVRTIRVNVVRNVKSGLLVALSPDMKGLMVAARTEEQIEEELPGAIQEMLEAAGHRVISVTAEPDPKGLPAGFSTTGLIASARLAA